jgi:hypothetical protein
VFGDRKDTVFLELKALLEPFGITRFYTDGWGAYERHLPARQQVLVNIDPLIDKPIFIVYIQLCSIMLKIRCHHER